MKEIGQKVVEQHKNYNMQSWSKQGAINPIPIAKAEGIYMYDYEGKRYADMSSQLVYANLGHSNKAINEAIKKRVDKFSVIAPFYADEDRSELSEKLIGLLPDNFGKVFYTNGGAEANENAIRIARMYTGRHKIFSRYRSYHGATHGAISATGEPRSFGAEPKAGSFVKFFDPYVYRAPVPFATEEDATQYYLHMLEEQIKFEGSNQVAAIILETITGSNGVFIPPAGYLQGVRKLCDKYGILLICDEVMVGFGRAGTMFGFENWGIVPDMITFAKGSTCGYVPLGGVIMTKDIAKHFDDNLFLCGLTYSGHPLACAAAIAGIDYYIDNDILAHTQKVGKVLGELLEDLKAKHEIVGDVRYIGLFAAVELVRDRTTKEPWVPFAGDATPMRKIAGQLMACGFATFTHENMIIVAPPLIITEEQLREEIAKLDEVLGSVD